MVDGERLSPVVCAVDEAEVGGPKGVKTTFELFGFEHGDCQLEIALIRVLNAVCLPVQKVCFIHFIADRCVGH